MPERIAKFEHLPLVVSPGDLIDLAALLVRAVHAGAAISFLDEIVPGDAAIWWRKTLANRDRRSIHIVARLNEKIVGTVQVSPSWAPNQFDRADVSKLIVDPAARNLGIGAELMHRAERAAIDLGYRMLVLDTKRGDNAERLYAKLGWEMAGIIPDYAYDPDGHTLHDTVVFFRRLTGKNALANKAMESDT